MNKEEVYDSLISPHMEEIIAVCKGYKIAMVAQFAIPIESDPDLCCTSALTTKEYHAPPHMTEACSLLKNGRSGMVMAMTVSLN